MLPPFPQQPLGRVDPENQLVRIPIMKCETCGTKQKHTWFVLYVDDTGAIQLNFYDNKDAMEHQLSRVDNIEDYGRVQAEI